MYNAEHIANKIKQCAKEKNITLRTMLSDLHMGINTVSKISSGTEIMKPSGRVEIVYHL